MPVLATAVRLMVDAAPLCRLSVLALAASLRAHGVVVDIVFRQGRLIHRRTLPSLRVRR